MSSLGPSRTPPRDSKCHIRCRTTGSKNQSRIRVPTSKAVRVPNHTVVELVENSAVRIVIPFRIRLTQAVLRRSVSSWRSYTASTERTFNRKTGTVRLASSAVRGLAGGAKVLPNTPTMGSGLRAIRRRFCTKIERRHARWTASHVQTDAGECRARSAHGRLESTTLGPRGRWQSQAESPISDTWCAPVPPPSATQV